MKLSRRRIGFIVINFLIGLVIVGPLLLDPLRATAFLRVMVSFSPILLTVGTGLVFKYLFHQ